MLSIYIGKPGSGKSYYAVLQISKVLTDWANFEIKEGKPFGRILYTNLQLNIDNINNYISEQVGKNIDVSHYIQYLDEKFFIEQTGNGGTKKIEWWEKFETGGYIIIDEVHHYLGSEKTGGEDKYLVSFRNYISTHRHRQHDLIFITQHTDSIQKTVLSMAESCYHIVNIKAQVLPVLGIPFADIDVIKEAFGYKEQYIKILYGNYLGRAFKAESTFHELLKPSIFALYKSHTLANGESIDRPSLNLSPVGALLWFFKRHFWHLLIKGLILYLVIYIMYALVTKIPFMFADKIAGDMKKITAERTKDTGEIPVVKKRQSGQGASGSGASKTQEEIKPVGEQVFIIGKDFIITDKGRKKIGGLINVDGETRKITGIDIMHNNINTELVRLQGAEGIGAELGSDEIRTYERPSAGGTTEEN